MWKSSRGMNTFFKAVYVLLVSVPGDCELKFCGLDNYIERSCFVNEQMVQPMLEEEDFSSNGATNLQPFGEMCL